MEMSKRRASYEALVENEQIIVVRGDNRKPIGSATVGIGGIHSILLRSFPIHFIYFHDEEHNTCITV